MRQQHQGDGGVPIHRKRPASPGRGIQPGEDVPVHRVGEALRGEPQIAPTVSSGAMRLVCQLRRTPRRARLRWALTPSSGLPSTLLEHDGLVVLCQVGKEAGHRVDEGGLAGAVRVIRPNTVRAGITSSSCPAQLPPP